MAVGMAIFFSTIGIALCTTSSNRGIASVHLGRFMVTYEKSIRIFEDRRRCCIGHLGNIYRNTRALSVASFGTEAYALWIRAISWWDWTCNLGRSLANCIHKGDEGFTAYKYTVLFSLKS
ncbi:hypothetical protein Acr_19g0005660 [Actinidia rufa]|uniref:Uncharacterized protein n=1 Tax=Actinidia rufa TaxID=165716 RepID=A0A7J0GA17_9ERIC|nr:hypothetical protein Acr_19g0005660 [Actinidia rufa]